MPGDDRLEHEAPDVSEPRRAQTTDDPAAANGDPDRRDHRSLLDRAGVIGADSIAPNDPGNPFIPAPTPTSSGSAADEPDADAWAASGVPDHEIDPWKLVGATPTTAATLRRLGADPAAVNAAPVSADELVGWLWHGFAVHEVAAWLSVDSVRTAARRRDAGLAPPDS